MTRDKALLEKKSPAEAWSIVYPGVRGLESDPTLHPEHKHRTASMRARSLSWGVAQADQGRASDARLGLSSVPPLPFRCALVAPMVARTCPCIRNGSPRLPPGVCTLHTCRTTFAPSAASFLRHCCAWAGEWSWKWFLDASTSRHAFTSTASFSA